MSAWLRIYQPFSKFFNQKLSKWHTYNVKTVSVKNFKPICSVPVMNKFRKKFTTNISGNSVLCVALISSNVDVHKYDVEENIAHLLITARIALENGDVDRAEAILEMGLKISEDHQVFIGLPYIYDLLTSIALAHGDVEKAETLLVSAVEKMIQIGLPEDNHHIIDFKLRLSRIYSNFNNKDWAEIGFKTCLDAQVSKINKGDVSTRTGMLYVNVLFWYGVHMIKNEQYADAKKFLNTAYDYSAKIKGLSPYQEMVILYTLADLHMELGELDVALKDIQTAVLLGKGISSIDLPRCYVKLATIYTKMGVYDQAKTTAVEGQKLARLFNQIDVIEDALTVLAQINVLENNEK